MTVEAEESGRDLHPGHGAADGEDRSAGYRPALGAGVNGQLLMHFAALHKIDWLDYAARSSSLSAYSASTASRSDA